MEWPEGKRHRLSAIRGEEARRSRSDGPLGLLGVEGDDGIVDTEEKTMGSVLIMRAGG